jgi:hypothetical protein
MAKRRGQLADVAEGRSQGEPLGTARAVVCIDQEFKFDEARQLTIPRKSIFTNGGTITGDISGAWKAADQKIRRQAAIITADEMTISMKKRCAETHVQMFVDGVLNTDVQAKASDRDVWNFNDVLDYKRGQKQPIEFGTLVDGLALQAQLLTDADTAMRMTRAKYDADSDAAKCLSNAKSLAAQIGGGIVRQTSSVVIMGHPDAQEISLSCGQLSPTLFISWDKRAKPSSATMQLIGKSGFLFTGASQDEIKTLTNTCISNALKPDNNEIGNAEYDGVRAGCQSFRRDGGAGSVTFDLRFGSSPALSPPTATAVRDLNRASEQLQAKGREEAQASQDFAKWYLDDTVPRNVKATLMVVTRMLALGERCPSFKPPARKIAAMLVKEGIEADDVLPGGRYFQTFAMMASAMREGTNSDSVAEACEAASKYIDR